MRVGRARSSQGARDFTARTQFTPRRWALAIAGSAALLLEVWVLPQGVPGKWVFVFLVVLFPICLFLIVLHEAGHLAAGRLVGFRFEFVDLGPLRIARAGQRIRIRMLPKSSIPMAMAGCSPIDERNLRPRYAVFVAGGPIANLLAGAIAILLFLRWGCQWQVWSAPTSGQLWLSASLIEVASLSLLMFMGNLIPSTYGGYPSDGEQLRALLGGGSGAERQCAIASLQGRTEEGVRPRDWPLHLVERAEGGAADGTLFDIYGKVLGYYWALDRGDLTGAEQLLHLALASCDRHPKSSRFLVSLEATYFIARHRGDAASAWASLQRATLGVGPVFSVHVAERAMAAIYLARGDIDKARQWASKGLEAIRRAPCTGIEFAEADWLQEILGLCDTALNLPASEVALQSDPQSPPR